MLSNVQNLSEFEVVNEICAAALGEGWLEAKPAPDGARNRGVSLGLASQQIAVRILPEYSVEHRLENVRQDVWLGNTHREHYIIVPQSWNESIYYVRAALQDIPGKRVTCGTLAEFRTWLSTRLGPLGRLPAQSPVRRAMEKLLCLDGTPEPKALCPMVGKYEGSAIEQDFKLGQEGVQAVESLLGRAHGQKFVANVESGRDVDLILYAQDGLPSLRIEVKTENFDSGRITLETYSDVKEGKKGWLYTSEADVLISCFWKTGDLFVMDMRRVRAWAFANSHRFMDSDTHPARQKYKTAFWLASIRTQLLPELKDTVHLKIQDWFPTHYDGKFLSTEDLVSDKFASRTIRPQRPCPGVTVPAACRYRR